MDGSSLQPAPTALRASGTRKQERFCWDRSCTKARSQVAHLVPMEELFLPSREILHGCGKPPPGKHKIVPFRTLEQLATPPSVQTVARFSRLHWTAPHGCGTSPMLNRPGPLSNTEQRHTSARSGP